MFLDEAEAMAGSLENTGIPQAIQEMRKLNLEQVRQDQSQVNTSTEEVVKVVHTRTTPAEAMNRGPVGSPVPVKTSTSTSKKPLGAVSAAAAANLQVSMDHAKLQELIQQDTRKPTEEED